MNKNIILQFEKLVMKNQSELNKAIENKDSDLQRKESFRLRTNRRILSILRNYDESINKSNYKELIKIGGIGKGTIKKIGEILEYGYILELSDVGEKEIRKEEVIKELEGVINIGRSNALELYEKGVKSVVDLKRKVKSGKLEVNDKIKLGLKYYGVLMERIPREEIDGVNRFIGDRIEYMNRKNKLESNNKFIYEICGSYRRGKSYSGDVDVLITKMDVRESSKNVSKYLGKIVRMLKRPWKSNNNDRFLIDDMTENVSTKYMGFASYRGGKVFRIDIRFVGYDSYYSALLYFTGSGELNKIMRNKAKELGMKLSEYGLYKDGKRIRVRSERDVFKVLGMDYLEPKYR